MHSFLKSLQGIRAELGWLTGALMFAVIPHALRLPLWMPLTFYALALWRLYLATTAHRAGSKSSVAARFGRQLIMLLIVIGVLNNYGTLVGRDAGVALLVLLAGVKLLELQYERDYYIGAFIAMFLVLTNFLYSQSILAALYLLVSVSMIVIALISLNDPNQDTALQTRARLALSMLSQALPLLLVLFILFPRVDGPLWGLPKDALAGSSGLDDEMSPGQISQLSLSNKVAFRVEFSGDVPANAELYWRGPVLWYSDGVKWVADKRRREAADVSYNGTAYDYMVTMEATDKKWLYGLEMVNAAPEKAFISHDQQLLTRRTVRDRKRYDLRSYTDYVLPAASGDELQMALQLPQGYHAKTIALGASWRNEGKNSRQILDAALTMFNQQAFYYTLTPPLLLEDSVDEFLFETRQGFCEHYAASFVILMRAAGIPARVVTGYQGGEMNPIGNYLIVRQRDAHAWAEIWLEDAGWLRVDPTAAVAPQRIQDGIDNALPQSIVEIPLGLQNNKVVLDLWRRIRYRLDAINNRWNQWVLGYDNRRQSTFLSNIGFGEMDWRGMTGSLLALTALVLLAVYWQLYRHEENEKDQARRLYDSFCKKLARDGIPRRNDEGPRAFATRAADRRPELATIIDRICGLYINIRYRSQSQLLPRLKTEVRSFRPGKPGLQG